MQVWIKHEPAFVTIVVWQLLAIHQHGAHTGYQQHRRLHLHLPLGFSAHPTGITVQEPSTLR